MTESLPLASAGFPLLTMILFTLPLGAAAVWLLPADHARRLAFAVGALELALTLLLTYRFDPALAGFQFVDRASWLPTLNVDYLIGVDGISVLFLPVTALLFLGVVAASWTQVRVNRRLFYSLLMLLETFTLGIFTALDMVLFFLFWELTLVPLYFLTSLWGIGPNRRYAAVKYTLFMLAGGVPLLFAIILLALNHAGIHGVLAFDLPTLLTTPFQSHRTEILVFLLLLLGFAVKTPLFPFHTWLPVATQEGPVATAATLAGLKLGAFGLIRFAVPLAPNAAQELHWLLAGLGVVGVLYGAVLALNQTNLRRMLAFSSMSHVGLVVLGIASLSVQGVQGAIFQLLNFALAAGGGFLVAGFLHHRIGSTEFVTLGGAARSMPFLAACFLLFGLAGMGLPLTSGFPGEFLILTSAITTHTGAGLAALFGAVLGAGYFLMAYRRVFLGPVSNPVVTDAWDLLPRERAIALVCGGVILLLGLFPGLVLERTQTASQAWVDRVQTSPTR